MFIKYFQKHKTPLAVKIPILLLVSYMLIIIAVFIISYEGLEYHMKQESVRLADGVTMLMENAIDKDMIDKYIEENYFSEEYDSVLRYLHTLKDSNPNIYYMYIYRFHYDKPTGTVIFDLDEEYSADPPQESIDWIGQEYQLEGKFADETRKLTAGKNPVYHEVTTSDGERLLSYVKPVYNDTGKYICSVCVDYSLKDMQLKAFLYVINIGIFLLITIAIILLCNTYMIKRMVTDPITESIEKIKKFRYETEDDRVNNLRLIEEMDIQTGDEIEDFYHSYIDNMKESMYYMQNFSKASKQIDKLAVTAYRDELTGVGNRADYMKRLDELGRKHAEGNNEYGIVMLDINNLKHINDSFGHDKGDEYIRGCCKIICDTFKHSPVCRIGGDEFVVILLNDDYTNRIVRVNELKETFRETANNDKEWERFSAAVGFAVGDVGKEIHDVIVLADKMMYKDKLVVKQKIG